jgi:hypothetical protein
MIMLFMVLLSCRFAARDRLTVTVTATGAYNEDRPYR